MPHSRVLLSLLLAATIAFVAACGGSNNPPASLFQVGDTALPAMLTGEPLEYEIPIVGGCGGPYILTLIQGDLPPGLRLDNETHSIRGTLFENGEYAFTIQVTDRGCEPFLTTIASFTISVGVGEITVVDVLRGGEPVGLVPVGTGFSPADPGAPSYNPDYPALPAAIFDSFVVLDLKVAGGHGPYYMQVYGGSSVPGASAELPLGASVIPSSTSISGAPQEEADEGAFFLTFEIIDAQGTRGYFTCYWLVYSPPLELVPTELGDGRAGVEYLDNFTVVGGVPPFIHEFVEGIGSKVRITSAAYPTGTSNDEGPNYDELIPGVPPEGIYILEGPGDEGYVRGIPRRRGDFKLFYHVYSPLLSNSALQNRWGEYDLHIEPAEDFAHDPTYTVDGAFTASAPYARIADAEQSVAYKLQLVATGGVPHDGWSDEPHSGDRVQDADEAVGPGLGYTWDMEWDPDGANNAPIAHMELLADGLFRSVPNEENALIPQLDQALEFTVTDQALPATSQSLESERVRFSIGPDRVILTQSSTSYTTATTYDNRAMNDTTMTVRVMIPSSSGNAIRAPSDKDLVGADDGKIGLPSEVGSATLATLLSNLDLCRVSINPTGWWDDTNHLNPRAARPFQHSDSNGVYGYYRSLAYAGTTSYLGSSSYSYRYQIQPTATCVRLPKCTSSAVTKDHAQGVYVDGGKFYVFDSSAYFGIFVIRRDGRLYVPAAFNKSSTGWRSFGDNWTEAYKSAGSANSINKMPQMTVSPDGRFAALKLKSSTTYSYTEYADDSAILLISLTGERVSAWGDEVYTIIDTGSNGSSSEGYWHFASSSTLTNRYLYYIIASGSTTYAHYRDHYIYRYDLFSGDDEGALLHSNFNKEWTNVAGSAMQTPCGMWGRPFHLYSGPDPQMLSAHGHNAYESSLAPHPFRVNADGNACAILAGQTTASTRSWDTRYYNVWVDYDGELHQLSQQRRHHSGGGRGIQLTQGPTYSPCAYQWGHYDGPTSRFEISDDGLSVASVYNRHYNSSSYLPYGSSSYSTVMYFFRSDLVAYTTTDEWDSRTIHEISGDTSQDYQCSGEVFQDSIIWRFGALTFTAENDGLVFWAGYPNYVPTGYSQSSYSYYGAQALVGSIYSYQFSNKAIKNILSSTYGGCNKTVGSTLTSISFSTSSFQTDGGVIKPIGGWVSPNRNFLYVINKGGLSSAVTYRRDGSILGVNIRSLDTSKSINGRTDGRAYHPSGLNTYDSFYPIQYYIPYGIGYYYYSAIYCQYYQFYGDGQRAAATDNGRVFFCGVRATSTYYSNYQSSAYGGCVNLTHYAYPYQDKSLYVFDQDVGGNMNLIIDAPSWGNTGSYHTVGYINVSDDGSAVAAVDSTDVYYDWNDLENLNVWSNIQLDSSGKLVGTPTRDTYETGLYVGSTSTFTPQGDRIIYAAGTGNENAKKLTRGNFGTSGQKQDYGFDPMNYNVLHAGR